MSSSVAQPDLPEPLAMALLRASQRPHDGLSPLQFRVVVAAIAAAHVGAIWGILQVPAVRATVLEAAPIFVELLAPPAPPAPPPPPPPLVKPVVKAPEPKLVTAAPSPAPAQFTAPPAPEEPVLVVPAPVEAPPAPPTPPAPPPPPRQIPASEVQYLVRPSPEYPRMSIRAGETGQVMVRVYIDEQGMPRQVLVQESSGFPRLDEAAVVGVRKARFKPYIHNGVPTAGWARIPIPFELER